MRILLTADPEVPVPPVRYGGIERIVDALVRFYQAHGHDVCLVAHPESRSPAGKRVGWPGRTSTSVRNTIRHALTLRRVTREFRPDIVHSFSRLAYLFPLLSGPIPKIMSYQRHTGGRNIALASRLGGRSLRFTGCSEFIRAMGAAGGGTWQAIPNFVELDKIDFAPRVAPDAPLVFLSRVESIKGPDVAIAITRGSGRKLLLAGNRAAAGPERDFWDRTIAPHLGGQDVEYVGEVDDAQKNVLLGRAAALVVPIQWDEPFGIVFAESLAAGTPVISCPRGALPEIVQPGQNGFLIRTVDEGVAAVGRISTIDRARCRQTAETRFSVGVAAEQYLGLYRDMIAQTR